MVVLLLAVTCFLPSIFTAFIAIQCFPFSPLKYVIPKNISITEVNAHLQCVLLAINASILLFFVLSLIKSCSHVLAGLGAMPSEHLSTALPLSGLLLDQGLKTSISSLALESLCKTKTVRKYRHKIAIAYITGAEGTADFCLSHHDSTKSTVLFICF